MPYHPTFLPPSSPDRVARRRLSLLLRQFALGRCNGDQLTEWHAQVSRTSDDLTLQKLLDENWLFIQEADEFVSDDGKTLPLSKEDRKGIARWVLYLRSEQTYKWPPWRGWALVCRNLGRVLTWLSFGLVKFDGLRYEDYGDLDIWPFLNRAEYEAALKAPRLLCGKQAA